MLKCAMIFEMSPLRGRGVANERERASESESESESEREAIMKQKKKREREQNKKSKKKKTVGERSHNETRKQSGAGEGTINKLIGQARHYMTKTVH